MQQARHYQLAMPGHTSHTSESTAPYLEVVLGGCMDEDGRRVKPCCWAAVQYHMAVMMRWHRVLSPATACQVLTQLLAAAE